MLGRLVVEKTMISFSDAPAVEAGKTHVQAARAVD